MKKVRLVHCCSRFERNVVCIVGCMMGALMGAFVKDTDYILLTPQVKQTDYARGGHNKSYVQ